MSDEKQAKVQDFPRCHDCEKVYGSEHQAKCKHFTLAPGKGFCPNPECLAPEKDCMGHEVRGVYDGVLYWVCMKCGTSWPRNFGMTRRTDISIQAVEEYRAEREARAVQQG